MLNQFNNCIFMLSNIYFWPRAIIGKILASCFKNSSQNNLEKGIFIFNTLILKAIIFGSVFSLGTLYLGLLCAIIPYNDFQKKINRILSLTVSLPLYSTIILPNFVKFIFKLYPEIKATHNEGIRKNIIRASTLYYYLFTTLSFPNNNEFFDVFNENVVEAYFKINPKMLDLIRNFDLPLFNIKEWNSIGFFKKSTYISNFNLFDKNRDDCDNSCIEKINKELNQAINSNDKSLILEKLNLYINQVNSNNKTKHNFFNTLENGKLIKFLIDSPIDTRNELSFCLKNIPSNLRALYIVKNELIYHCVKSCKDADKFKVLLSFLKEHEINEIIDKKFISYALFINPSIGLYVINKLLKNYSNYNEENKDNTSYNNQSSLNTNQNLREFCSLINLEYRDDLQKSEIDTAYRKACKKYHPDKNPNDLKAAEKFKKIQACKNILRPAF